VCAAVQINLKQDIKITNVFPTSETHRMAHNLLIGRAQSTHGLRWPSRLVAAAHE